MVPQPLSGQHASVSAETQHDEGMHPFGANAIRLSNRLWAVTALLVGTALFAIPRLWERSEQFESTVDARVPYSLSDDYWYYDRQMARLANEDRIVMLGDSVIWGEYVAPNETLSHFLSEPTGNPQFANGGLNGAHPLALGGLVHYYTSALSGRPVVLHCNLLWMSSPERDLQVSKEVAFNHPQLVPQFTPWIPCYRATFADRMGIAFDRSFSFRGWVKHMRIRHFDGQDIPTWTLEHPYENPLGRILDAPRPEDDRSRRRAVAWTERGIEPQDFQWVELNSSLQWQAFRETVTLLRRRGNDVFVLLGPLNQHLLTPDSRRRFLETSSEVRQWLEDNQVRYLEPAVLSSELYADASHPLARGYEQLAREIHESQPFQDWLSAVQDRNSRARSQ